MISPLLKHPLLREPEPVSDEIQGSEEAVQRSPNLEQLYYWESYEEQLNENPGPREASLPNPGQMEIYLKERV